MKKTYIIPEMQLTVIACEQLIAESLGKHATGADSGVVLVKENNSSTPDYNVWDDDWSKN